MPEPARPSSLGVAVVGFVLLVAFSPTVAAPSWTIRAAAALIAGAAGLPRLVALAGAGMGGSRTAARLAGGFVLWAGLAAATAATPAMALFGRYNQGTGLLFIVAMAGIWALATAIEPRSKPLIEVALLAGVLLNAGIAVLEAAADLTSLHLPRLDDRSTGLLGNPVHLGALVSAGIALLAPRLARRPLAWLPAGLLLGAAVDVSGGRSALLVAAALVVVEVVARGWFRAAVLAAVLILGGLTGAAVAAAGPGPSVSAAGRATSDGGITARTGTWRTAALAVADRPLLGVGPGRFEAATSHRRTLAIARAEGAGKEFTDAHNIVVEYATTTGLPGLLLFLGWIGLAAWRAAGPLRTFALALLAVGLVEPQSVSTTLVAMLALGAAVHVSPGVVVGRAGRMAAAGLVGCAVVSSGILVAGDMQLERTSASLSIGQAERAVQLLPPWPEPRTRLALAYAFHGIADHRPGAEAEAIRAYRAAARRDPAEPALWHALATAELGAGRLTDAEEHYRRAIARDPWAAQSLRGLARTLIAMGRTGEAEPLLTNAALVAT